MDILGAIFAGGRSSRFGSDKALVPIDGVPMLTRVVQALAPQCDAIGIIGRSHGPFPAIDDLPRPGLGPLGALAGALAYARAHGFSGVLTCGCDLPDVPDDLRHRLSPGPAVILGQPLLGLWPSDLADSLLSWIECQDDRSMRSWIAETGARRVAPYRPLFNINTQADLAEFQASRIRRRITAKSPE